MPRQPITRPFYPRRKRWDQSHGGPLWQRIKAVLSVASAPMIKSHIANAAIGGGKIASTTKVNRELEAAVARGEAIMETIENPRRKVGLMYGRKTLDVYSLAGAPR